MSSAMTNDKCLAKMIYLQDCSLMLLSSFDLNCSIEARPSLAMIVGRVPWANNLAAQLTLPCVYFTNRRVRCEHGPSEPRGLRRRCPR